MSFIITAAQMRRAEEAAIEAGATGEALMEKAGGGVAAAILRGWEKRSAAIACGPGNNGGDGFVVARRLKEAGWSVRVGLLGDREKLQGDAAAMASRLDDAVERLTPDFFDGAGLIVDALFGTGLSRAIEGEAASITERMNKAPAPVVSVDIPSGVDADTGAVMGGVAGAAVQAAKTVTFLAKKPGHVLFPGRALCGDIEVVDIGIDASVLQGLGATTAENAPQLWGAAFRRPTFQSHKYSRGAVAVFAGPRLATGAARLAATAALRAGAGLVTLYAPASAADECAAHATALMVRVAETPAHVGQALGDPRIRAALFGPGAGVGEATRAKALAILQGAAGAVLDADALTSFEGAGEALFDALGPGDVITPHPGEFMRLFSGRIKAPEERLGAALSAAARAGCVVVLKGADTVVAAPDGRAAINTNAPPDLATAGSGDVLAGIVAGLRAQGMPAFEAASAGVWLHGACARAIGPGLISEDLPSALPGVLRALLAPPRRSAASGDAPGRED